MEVRAKKALGQHFLTDQSIAKAIVDALSVAGTASPDRGHPWPRKWEGPAPEGVGGMSEATQGVSGGTPTVSWDKEATIF